MTALLSKLGAKVVGVLAGLLAIMFYRTKAKASEAKADKAEAKAATLHVVREAEHDIQQIVDEGRSQSEAIKESEADEGWTEKQPW